MWRRSGDRQIECPKGRSQTGCECRVTRFLGLPCVTLVEKYRTPKAGGYYWLRIDQWYSFDDICKRRIIGFVQRNHLI
jgi:hypothetical protein